MQTTQPLQSTPALPASVQSLTVRETRDLFRALNGGTAGFDFGKYNLAQLRAILESWRTAGVPYAVMDGHAVAIGRASQQQAAAAMPAPPVGLALTAAPLPPTLPEPTLPAPQSSVADAIREAMALTAISHPAATLPVYVPGAAIPIPAVGGHGPAVAFPAQPGSGNPFTTTATPETLPPTPLPTPVSIPLPAPLTPAPHGRAYARDLFNDLPASIVAQIPASLTLAVFTHPDAEQPSRSYRFNAATLVPVLIAMGTGIRRAWLAGPRGTGKTEFVRQLAARTGRALYRVNFHRFTEPSEIMGDMGLSNGATMWQDGPVTLAVRNAAAGAVLLLDEVTYGTPGSIACLNPVLETEGARLRLPRTGEALDIHPDLFIVAADNTFGTGDASGEYAARNETGADTRDRFKVKVAFDYLDAADERALLRDAVLKECGRKPTAAALAPLLKILHVAREKAGLGELQGAPSFRGAVAFATLLAYGLKPSEAYTVTIINGSPEESHEALRAIFAAHWPTDASGDLTGMFA